MSDFNSEVFCARLDERMASIEKTVRETQTSTRKSVHRMRNDVEEHLGSLTKKVDALKTDADKRSYVFPLVTSAITALIVGMIMHALHKF